MPDYNFLVSEREGRTGEFLPEVIRLEQAKLVSSLFYGTRAKLGLNLPAFENKITQLMTVYMETVRMAKSRPK